VVCVLVMDLSVTGMRVFREVAERGSFTAAAAALDYTQSAVSRQVAALESALGGPVFRRHRSGVQLTAAGRAVLRHTTLALDEIDAALRTAHRPPPPRVAARLGAYPAAGAVLLPRTLAALRRAHPELDVTTREGTTPALVRALRAGSLDLAVVAQAPPFRALDAENPELAVEILAEADLRVAVPATHPLASDDAIDVDQLRAQRWIASPSSAGEVLLGVWPGLGGRIRIAHSSRDWLAKLRLVAAGCGITTIPDSLADAVPDGVRVLPVRGGPRETRRVLLAHLPGRHSPVLQTVREALRAAATR
jgi:DNA-binding transcriptional LysR family regulator